MAFTLTPYARALLRADKDKLGKDQSAVAAGPDQPGNMGNDQSVILPGSVGPGVPAHPIVTPPFARGGPSRREGGRAQPAKPGRTGAR
jgi:hypothetical protein